MVKDKDGYISTHMLENNINVMFNILVPLSHMEVLGQQDP
jgi:hypothetical protein